MFDEAVLQFLARPLIARLSTVGADGYPHTVPVWFDSEARGGGIEFVVVSDRSARKVRNVERNPKVALAIGGDPFDGDGYLVRGDMTIEDDADHVVTHRMIDRYEHGPRNEELRAAWKDDDIVVLRLRPLSAVRAFV
jgi:PPOX class probable F420-dependent enzyme